MACYNLDVELLEKILESTTSMICSIGGAGY